MAITQTDRLGLTKWGAATDPYSRAQRNADQDRLELLASVDAQGTLAARPAAGVRGRYFWAEDVGWLFRDTGTTWHQIYAGTTAYLRLSGGTLSGEVNFADQLLRRPRLVDVGERREVRINPGAALAVDYAVAGWWDVTVDQNITVTVSNWPGGDDGGALHLVVRQPATARSLTVTGGKWPRNTPPTMQPSTVNTFTLTSSGGGTEVLCHPGGLGFTS